MTASIHQIVVGFSSGDAISNEALAIQSVLRDRGFRSEIFACRDFVQTKLSGVVYGLEDLDTSPKDIVLYHHSIGSPAGDLVHTLRCRRVMIYHNVTPPELIRPFNPVVASQLEWGSQQLRKLRGQFEIALADSPYSEQELREIGYRETAVLPILLDESHYNFRPDRRLRRKYNDDRLNLLFVGRIAPNKNAHELLRSFSILQKCIVPRSRLLLVGSNGGFTGYYYGLQNMVRDLGLSDVEFAGHVSQSQLLACYAVSDLFVCLSEHEGFCVPIVEAFRYRLPVIALSRAAVPSTVGDAGLLIDSLDPSFVAEAVEFVRSSDQLRQDLTHRGWNRYQTLFSPDSVRARLEHYLDQLTG